MRRIVRRLAGFLCLAFAARASAFDPIGGAVGKGVATALDVRSTDEVRIDVEIDAALTRKLLRHDDFKNVSILNFACRAALDGVKHVNSSLRIGKK